MRKLLCISYLGHKTNDWVRSKINFLGSSQEPLLATIKRQQPAWFGHVTRHDSLSKNIPQGTLKGGRRRGRQKKYWMDNIKEWTPLSIPELPQGPPAEKTGRGSLLNRPSCPPDDPIGQRPELKLNFITLDFFFKFFMIYLSNAESTAKVTSEQNTRHQFTSQSIISC